MNLSNLCAEFSKCTSPESKLEIVTKMILLQEKSIEEYARKHFYVQRMSYEDLKMAAIQRILEVIPRLEESDPSRIMAIFFNSMIYAMYDEFRLNNYSCCLNNYAGYRINKEKSAMFLQMVLMMGKWLLMICCHKTLTQKRLHLVFLRKNK